MCVWYVLWHSPNCHRLALLFTFTHPKPQPAEHEILTCRLIDRPLRPLIADGWRHETQLLSWVLSYDGVRSCDPLAITAAAARIPAATASIARTRRASAPFASPPTMMFVLTRSQREPFVGGPKTKSDLTERVTPVRPAKGHHALLFAIIEATAFPSSSTCRLRRFVSRKRTKECAR